MTRSHSCLGVRDERTAGTLARTNAAARSVARSIGRPKGLPTGNAKRGSANPTPRNRIRRRPSREVFGSSGAAAGAVNTKSGTPKARIQARSALYCSGTNAELPTEPETAGASPVDPKRREEKKASLARRIEAQSRRLKGGWSRFECDLAHRFARDM